MTLPSLPFAVVVAVLKGLRPANNLEKAFDDFSTFHETTSSTHHVSLSARFQFSSNPFLDSYKGKHSSLPSAWRHAPPSLSLTLFSPWRSRCRCHYRVFLYFFDSRLSHNASRKWVVCNFPGSIMKPRPVSHVIICPFFLIFAILSSSFALCAVVGKGHLYPTLYFHIHLE